MFTASIIGMGVSGVGIGLGGVGAYVFRKTNPYYIAQLMAITAGLLIGLLFLELIPESVRLGGYFTFVGMFISILLIYRMEKFTHQITIITNSAKKDVFFRSGLLIALSNAFHNFPSGMALGASYTQAPEAGWNLITIMVLHNFPDGFALGLPLVLAGFNPLVFLFLIILMILPLGMGALLGSMFGEIHPVVLTLLYSSAIGVILFVAWNEIFLHSLKTLRWTNACICLIVGLIVSFLFHKFI